MKQLSLETLSKTVISRRKALNLRQLDLARATGINRSLISQIENTEFTPSANQLMALSQILDFDINDDFTPNEKKFLSFDFYLRQNEKNKKDLLALKDMFNRKVSTIANNLVYMFKENDFTIAKTKKA